MVQCANLLFDLKFMLPNSCRNFMKFSIVVIIALPSLLKEEDLWNYMVSLSMLYTTEFRTDVLCGKGQINCFNDK